MDISNVRSRLAERDVLVPVMAGSFLVYLACLVLYRLYLSPIAQVPGSKLAAFTGWYEAYLDVFKGGQFTFQIGRWHQQYGPVVRISPWEVHINDPDFYDEIYNSKSRHDKLPWQKERFNCQKSTNEATTHEEHSRRRAALSPFFSRQKILAYTPYIASRIDKLCTILESDYKGTAKPVTLNNLFGAYATDALTWYIMALDYKMLEQPEFKSSFSAGVHKLVYTTHVANSFPWFMKAVRAMPEAIVGWCDPDLQGAFDFHMEIKRQVRRIMNGENDGNKDVQHETVFHALLDSPLRDEEKQDLDLLYQEAAFLTGAGIDTVKTALSVGSFWILKDHAIYERLHKELAEAMPDPTHMLPLPELEKLPYLNAVAQEALRLSIGVAQRLTRTSPLPVRYGARTLPPGTLFSMSAYQQHLDPAVFPDPHRFAPERWLAKSELTPANGKPAARYLVPFGRGPRMCVGMNFALAELYMALAGVFRRLHLELHKTDPRAVSVESEYLVPMPPADTEGVRVLVK